MPVHSESFRKNYAQSIEEVNEYGYSITLEEFEPLISKCLNVTRTYASPSVLRRYLKLEMSPYLVGKRTFDDCYDNLKNTLELYKDE